MNYIELLQAELRPAFGCTEPIALAYAAAKSVAVLGECPTSMTARCSANIIKNVKNVTIPNSGGRKGLACAAISGVIPCFYRMVWIVYLLFFVIASRTTSCRWLYGTDCPSLCRCKERGGAW